MSPLRLPGAVAMGMTRTGLAVPGLPSLTAMHLRGLIPAFFLALGFLQAFLIDQASLEQLLMQGIAHPNPQLHRDRVRETSLAERARYGVICNSETGPSGLG